MPTRITEVYERALAEINSYAHSDSLETLFKFNRALFYRKMFLYFQAGIPMFDRPVGMLGKLKYKKPEWADKYFQLLVGTSNIDSGIIGYDSVTVTNDEGEPLRSEYNSGTGKITIIEPLKRDCEIGIDAYKDGNFYCELNDKELAICGMCVAYKWFTHFSMDELNMTQKMKDSSFQIGSEFGDKNANTTRMKAYYEILSAEISSYANDYSLFGKQGWKPCR